MQLKNLVLAALAAVATAAPTDSEPEHHGCEPATYSCTRVAHNKPGWQVCNTSGEWVVCSLFSLSIFSLLPSPSLLPSFPFR